MPNTVSGETQQRRIAAIMFTDIVRFAELTHRDEALTLQLLGEHRTLLRPLFDRHHGKEIETAGDSFFVEFPSALDAFECAAAIQQNLHERNRSVAEARRIQLRIGLHVGDVVQMGEKVHGDGVNICARILTIAEPGGICLSEDVFRQVKNKVALQLVRLGAGELKHINTPVIIYRVVGPWQESRLPAQLLIDRTRFFFRHGRSKGLGLILVVALGIAAYVLAPLFRSARGTETPSLAVLYLKNLGTAEDEPYSYGITQDLIVDVAKAGLIRVATMKDIISVQKTDLPAEKIGEQLRVRYIMEGSLKREADIFHLTAQIVEASTGKTLWADRIQAKVAEAADLQGRLARAIIDALKLTPSVAVTHDLTRRKSADPEAYEFYLRAGYLFHNQKNKDDLGVARGLYEKSAGLDSTFIGARVGLGWTYEVYGEYDKAQRIYAEAVRVAESLADKSEEAHARSRLGVVQWQLGDYKKAVAYDSQSLSLYRQLGDMRGEGVVLNNIGSVEADQGDFVQALDSYDRCWNIMRQLGDRSEEGRVLNNMGDASGEQGEYAKALDLFTRCFEIRKELNDRRGQAIALENIGNIYWEIGAFDTALEYENRSLGICQELGVRPIEAAVLGALGQVYGDQGEAGKALDYYGRALNVLAGIGERLLQGIVIMNTGKIYLDQGRYAVSIDSLKKAVSIFEETGSKENLMLGSSWLALAELRSESRLDAGKNLTRAEGLFNSLPKGPDYIKVAWNLSQLYSRLGDNQKASAYLEDAYREVKTRADHTPDNQLRTTYLTNVPIHREIVAAAEKLKR